MAHNPIRVGGATTETNRRCAGFPVPICLHIRAIVSEQMTRVELARLTWKDSMLPLHHICINCLLFRVQFGPCGGDQPIIQPFLTEGAGIEPAKLAITCRGTVCCHEVHSYAPESNRFTEVYIELLRGTNWSRTSDTPRFASAEYVCHTSQSHILFWFPEELLQ